MVKRATDLLDRYAGWRSILLAVAASVLAGVLPLTHAVARMRVHSPDAAPLDMATGYTPDEAYAMIARYGDDVRAFYIANAFTADLIGPALFNLTFALLMTACLKRLPAAGPRWRTVALVLPLSAFLIDLTENVLLSIVVARFPARLDGLVRLASVATLTKRIAIFGTWGLTAVLGLAAARALVRRPSRG